MKRMSRSFVVLATVVLVLSGVSLALAETIVGRGSIIDGDTLEIHGTRIRLWGVDAPESTQLCRGEDSLPYRCGAKAAKELDRFIAGRPISCQPVSRDAYGRTVATCAVDDVDLGDWLVQRGLALDWPKHSKGRYERARREAEHTERGLWAGTFVAPWLYRACSKTKGRSGDCSDGANGHLP